MALHAIALPAFSSKIAGMSTSPKAHSVVAEQWPFKPFVDSSTLSALTNSFVVWIVFALNPNSQRRGGNVLTFSPRLLLKTVAFLAILRS